jgi:hypothetical protein
VLVAADERSGTRYVVEECVREGKTVFARQGLLGDLLWLQRAAKRGGTVVEWRHATNIVAKLT